ncbi:reverse transcriptase [Cucumis melo var. makuwa]|uniref:Reverse transcriptase n=1 Tax=Cucumis melo var. makuwa TaxID=1194695 RepID=A0A5D3C2D1_CUCMM|nr:reverse transcriptase [Cucumis melo var. makuwa]
MFKSLIAEFKAASGTSTYTPSSGLSTTLLMYSENSSVRMVLEGCHKFGFLTRENCPSDGIKHFRLEEVDRTYDFLARLNLKFDVVRSRILGHRPISSLMEVCSEVLLQDITSATNIFPTRVIDFAAFKARSFTHDSIPQFLSLISVDGMNPWILDSGATNHLTGSFESFVSYIPCASNEKIRIADGSLAPIAGVELGRMIDTTWHNRGLCLLDDDASSSSISRMSVVIILYYFGKRLSVVAFFDNGREFQNHTFIEFLSSKEIVHLGAFAPPSKWGCRAKEPSSYGSSPFSYVVYFFFLPICWVLTVTHLINRISSRVHLQTPLECLEESYPSTHLLLEVPFQMFGYTTYVHSHDLNQTKLPLELRSDIVVLEDMGEKGSVDAIEIMAEAAGNEAKRDHLDNLDEYDSSLDIPIVALRKGTRSCTKHSICDYVSYENLSPQFRAFTTNLDSILILKNIHIALECPKWKTVVMKEMRDLEKNKTWELCALPKGHKTVVRMMRCQPIDMHIKFNLKRGNSLAKVPVDKEKYQRLVGKLIYLSHIRPDIAYVGRCSGRLTEGVLRPILNLTGQGLSLTKIHLWILYFCVGNLVTWMSKKQRVVTKNSVEAEYRAMSLWKCKEIWLHKVLFDLRPDYEVLMKLFCDNKAAISIPVQHDRTKNVEIVIDWTMVALHSFIPSSQQVADILTKGLLR